LRVGGASISSYSCVHVSIPLNFLGFYKTFNDLSGRTPFWREK